MLAGSTQCDLARVHVDGPDTAAVMSAELDETILRAVALAEQLALSADARVDRRGRARASQLARMMTDAAGKAFTFALIDEVFRSENPHRQAARFRQLLQEFGVPGYFKMADRNLIRLAGLATRFAPGSVMPLVAGRLRADTRGVILRGEPKILDRFLGDRRRAGFSINLNQLGEAVLGEAEARQRLQAVMRHLSDPNINYVSVKISAIFSQINLLAWDATLDAICERLRELYRTANQFGGFVNLDMEEYRDLALTVAAFRRVLDEPEFQKTSAGIVLQAYIPDSWQVLQQLTQWAQARVEAGGADIKVRLVKGANLAMEAVEAEMHGWRPATYNSKAETDANYRRMVEFACQEQHARFVRVGVASHNLFDVALALTLRDRLGTTDRVEIEMLEGMANHQAHAVKDVAGDLLLYAPTVRDADFLSAMAYLVRRLEENTSPGNFLREVFDLRPGSQRWQDQKDRFLAGWSARQQVSSTSHRSTRPVRPPADTEFTNEPDSDWTQANVRELQRRAADKWRCVPLPERPSVEHVLSRAVAAQTHWSETPADERAARLRRVAEIFQQQRFETIACLSQEGKKAVSEADPEVSEAIDFANYYARHPIPENLQATPLGVVVVTPPWNFPYAIPAGGVLAALVAGNSVVLKPAPETMHTAWLLARQLWEAGIPRDVLQFFACPDEEGRELITDPRTSAVVLTGAWQTARLFQDWRPSLRLFAETSGKNALVVTAQADRELAVKDLVRSAFGHAGQKCSAASLAILEAEVFDDPVFMRQLSDATESLHVGPAGDPRSVVTPLIREPGPDLHRALTTLEAGEQWLVAPRCLGDDPCLWSPGIRLGVKPGSWFHRTECFGPVLGLMRAESLEQATEWQNATDYGLTAGLHSLDVNEQKWWQQHVQAGNLYINRGITGAIVQRQPFGGWKRSCVGPGAKAGGPNYVSMFCTLSDRDNVSLPAVRRDYQTAWEEHFCRAHDPTRLRAESNLFRYRAASGVLMRASQQDTQSLERAKLASELTGTPLEFSYFETEDAESLARRLATLRGRFEFFRTVSPPEDVVLRAAHEADLNWIHAPLTGCGRVELRHWLREQSLSRTLHRYGQLPEWLPPARHWTEEESALRAGTKLRRAH